MGSDGNRNLGPRLLVILIALGIVVLGIQPIRKQYGGARGLLREAFPSGVSLRLPSMEGIRDYLLSLDNERRRGNSGSSEVKQLKVAPGASLGASSSPRVGEGASAGSGALAGISRFLSSFFSGQGRDGNAPRRSLSGEEAVARNRPRDRTERAQLAEKSPAPPDAPKSLDRLSQQDREELNKLIDGF